MRVHTRPLGRGIRVGPIPPPGLFLILAIALALASPGVRGAAAQAENPIVFERLDVDVSLSDSGSAGFRVAGVLRNDGEVPVVPGYVILRLAPRGGGNLSVEGLEGRDPTRGAELEVVAMREGDTLIIRCSMWQPLRPGESERFEIRFEVGGVSTRGVLFEESRLTLGPLSSEVEGGRLLITPPEGEVITYADPPPEGDGWPLSGLGPGRTLDVRVETSRLPLPRLPVPGYAALWGSAAAAVAAAGIATILRSRTGRGGPSRGVG